MADIPSSFDLQPHQRMLWAALLYARKQPWPERIRVAPSANPGDSVQKRRRRSPLHQSSFELTDMSKIVSLAKRRGIIFQTSEIYGGFANS